MSIQGLQGRFKPLHITLILVAGNFLWRAVWIGTSQGAYTDGILQIDAFRQGLTYWPPFYAVLARLFVWIPGLDLEGSARLVSLIAGSLAVIPIEVVTRKLFGRRAALMAALVYTASPMALRWSLQVMTDATFMTLWICALAATLLAAEHLWPDLFDQGSTKRAPDVKVATQWLLLASVAASLASATRYQGVLLFPVVAFVLFRMIATSGGSVARKWLIPLSTLLPWLIVPAWLLRDGLGSFQRHFSQISDRAQADSFFGQLYNYWYLFEQFVLDSPYFITYGLFGFFLYGLFRTQFGTRRIRMSAWAALYLALILLSVQSVFQSFQSRYLLPLLPMVCVVAGHGLAVWERRCEKRRVWFFALAVPSLGFGLIFSALVAFYQGAPFYDLKQAARYIRDMDLPEETRIATTENFHDLIGPKLSFWSGGRKIDMLGTTRLPRPGDFIVLPSAYGGWNEYQARKRMIIEEYPARVVKSFVNVIYPLLPDIMEEPITHQNPIAWYLRYDLQRFETTILEVLDFEGRTAALPQGTSPAEALSP